MVGKFYAYYKGERINAYEALRKRTRREISTKVVQDAELFDSPILSDRYPVRPVKAKKNIGLPHFAYYPNFQPTGICLEKEGSKITFAHSIYQDIFLNLPGFVIQDGDLIVEVDIENVTVDLRTRVNQGTYYIVEIMYKLVQTYPYSYYYKWNGKLAMEIVVTTEVSKQKVDDLSSLGIQVCELTVPKSNEESLRKIDEKNLTPSELDAYYKTYFKKYHASYKNKGYKAFSKLLGDVVTKEEWKEEYSTMKKYEEQEAEMKKRIEKYQEEIDNLQQVETEYYNRIAQLEQNESLMNTGIDNLDKIQKSNKDLILKNTLLEDEKEDLMMKNTFLESEKEDWINEKSDLIKEENRLIVIGNEISDHPIQHLFQKKTQGIKEKLQGIKNKLKKSVNFKEPD